MLHYLHSPKDRPLAIPPDLKAYSCLIVIERPVTPLFRENASRQLVRTGCLYALAWGQDCSLWDDSIDYANMEQFGYGDIPDDRFVMTTWHSDKTLDEVFHFAQHNANVGYANQPLEDTLILDLVAQDRADQITALFLATDA